MGETPAADDLEPWSAGFCGIVQAADDAVVDPEDDLVGGEDDLPLAA